MSGEAWFSLLLMIAVMILLFGVFYVLAYW
jgi:hypothetical protein